MPESSKLRLWRNTIQLFYEYTSFNFVGPFKRANLADYKISPLLLSPDLREHTPDIVASGSDSWLAVELSNRGASKREKLEAYKTIDPRHLKQYALMEHTAPPDIISSRLRLVNDGPFCEILVDEKLVVHSKEMIGNAKLRDALAECDGTDLTRLPSLPFTLVADQMTSPEIRDGLSNIVMQLFAPGSVGMTPLQIVEQGLERLADKITRKDLHTLADHAKEQLDNLISEFLPGYLEFRGDTYQLGPKWRDNPRTREHIGSALRAWVHQAGTPTSLKRWWTQSSDQSESRSEQDKPPG